VPPDTRLPDGHTAIGQYLEATRTPLISLNAERIWTVDRDLFARVTAGYLEMMHGGVQGEVLWRPFDRSFAVGADLAWLRGISGLVPGRSRARRVDFVHAARSIPHVVGKRTEDWDGWHG
jgi:hypothetical protein